MRLHAAVEALFCLIGGFILMNLPCRGQALPSIAAGGVLSASSFGKFTSIAPGSWIEIYGSNLAADTRSWTQSDFSGVNAPTSLDGTSVTVGGQPAFIDYISPGQVNAQVPSNIGTGSQQIILTTGAGSSTPYTVSVNSTQPGLLAPASFKIGGRQYAAALFPDGATYVLPPGTIAGVASRRAQPGDTITLYGIGFGPVVPDIPAGQIVGQSNTLAATLQVEFGTALGDVAFSGLAPGAVGLYQFNVTVPNIANSDALPLAFTIGGVPGTQNLYTAVQGNAASQIQSLTLSSSSVAGGGSVVGTVVLSAPAPPGGAIVALSSNSVSIAVPASVTVPEAATSATFTIATNMVTSNQTATITASYGGNATRAALTVTSAVGTLPQFSLISANLAYSSDGKTTLLCSIEILGSTQGNGYMSATTGSCTFSPPDGSVFSFSASFGTITVSGQTFTLAGLQVGSASFMSTLSGMSSGITSGSMTLTLNPQGSPQEGTISGNFMLASPLATLSGSVAGNYAGMP
jgi:uncharacterized protein (TIGR03437 family)